MLKRKEFILGAAVGLTFAAAATAGGVIEWPGAHAEVPAVSGRLTPSAGAAGAAFAPPPGAPLSFADIFQQVAPAVVQIDVKTRVERPRQLAIPGLPFGFQLPPGVGPQPEEGEEGEDNSTTALGAGSGFFISADGYIVTNNHVVADATEITVKLSDERELTARLIGRDESTDLAVIKVDGGNFPFVSFEQSAEPRVGDWVIAVGNPFGLGGTATAGIVSARGRDIDSAYVDYIQIDAAINRGNSGGPTFDVYGRVIGVNTVILSPSGGSVGIGFAIPADVAKSITDRLMKGETIERGYIGVVVGDLSSEYKLALGLPSSLSGAYISEVTPGEAAEQGGLRAGDIVTALDGLKISGRNDLTRRIGQVRAGDVVRLTVRRGERQVDLEVRATRRPSEQELASLRSSIDPQVPNEVGGTSILGMSVAPLDNASRDRFHIPSEVNGLVVLRVPANGVASRVGIRPGHVIIQANANNISSVDDLQKSISSAKDDGRDRILLLVRTERGNQPVVVVIDQSER